MNEKAKSYRVREPELGDGLLDALRRPADESTLYQAAYDAAVEIECLSAVPPLRAREESDIALAKELYEDAERLRTLNIVLSKRLKRAADALSSTAGQEWREPEGPLTKDIRDAVWEVLSAWRPGMSDEVKHALSTKVVDRVAHRSDAPLPAPPVAEPPVAYCVFCKTEHSGGATCMGHHP